MNNFEITPGRFVGGDNPCFIIAEIGQNHQGDMEIAKKMISEAKRIGADCVKFQKCYLNEKFTPDILRQPYVGSNAFGATYGEHKKYLEFSDEQMRELQKFSEHEIHIPFTASAMDEKALDFLDKIKVPFIKIGSGDGNNLRLIEAAASTSRPLVVSTGMQDMRSVKTIYNTVKKHTTKFALLHCTSAYPTPPKDSNIRVIQKYIEDFPDIVIGYSGHEIGYVITLAAMSLGAKIIERHVTMSNFFRGTDHKCSLTPEVFGKMIRDIRTIEEALGSPVKRLQISEKPCYDKLYKTIVAKRYLSVGTVITENDLAIKVSNPKGVDAKYFDRLVGKTLNRSVGEDEPIFYGYLRRNFWSNIKF